MKWGEEYDTNILNAAQSDTIISLAIFMLACFLVDVCVFVSERVLLCSPGWS
jgi:hypothetical protein